MSEGGWGGAGREFRIKMLWHMSCSAGAAERLQGLLSCSCLTWVAHAPPKIPPKIPDEFYSVCFGLLALLSVVSGSHLIYPARAGRWRKGNRTVSILWFNFPCVAQGEFFVWLRQQTESLDALTHFCILELSYFFSFTLKFQSLHSDLSPGDAGECGGRAQVLLRC